MNYYVILIEDKAAGVKKTYNEKASRQGVAVDRALTSFLKQYHPSGRMAPTAVTIDITVARS